MGPENQDGRDPERVGLDRGREVAAGQVRDGVPKAAPGAEREAEGVEGAEAEQVGALGVQGGHRGEPNRPPERLKPPAARPSAQAPDAAPEKGRFRFA